MAAGGAGRVGWMPAGPMRAKILTGAAVFLGVMVLVVGAFFLARSERQFVTSQWEKRLRVSLADPMEKTAHWLRVPKRALAEVAANQTVKIYLSELKAAGYDRAKVPHGDTQAAYVSNYVVSAGRDGPFVPHDEHQAAGGRLRPMATAGLALFDGREHPVATTPGYRPSAALLNFFIASMSRGQTGPIVLVIGGHPTLVFFRPVRPLHTSGGPIGYVIGARDIDVDSTLGKALTSPLSADGGRIVLLAKSGDRVRYLAASDMNDVPPATQELSLAGLSGDLDAAAGPGRLVHGSDVSGQDALLFAERIDGSPLVIVASVPAKIALAGVTQRERALLTALLLAIVAMVAVAIAFNRHQVGVAAAEQAEAAVRERDEIASRETLLKAVVNAHPGAQLLVRDGRVALASARFAGELGLESVALTGKPLEAVLPENWRAPVQALLKRRGEGAALREEFEDDQGRTYIALVVFLAETREAALLVVDEITEQVAARERRTQIYRGIVSILLEAINRRDPAAAAHSRRTGALARQVALQLDMSQADVETAELAGNLQGVGKLFVPEALLRKTGRLSDEDRQIIEDGAERWLDLLDQISMDYPVAAVSRLTHELAYRWPDTTGDGRLLRVAAIVAAANAYVALTSPRAYRPARAAKEALSELAGTLPQLPEDVLETLRRTVAMRETAV